SPAQYSAPIHAFLILTSSITPPFRTTALSLSFFSFTAVDHRDLHSFPTRRSSDLRHFPAQVVVSALFGLLIRDSVVGLQHQRGGDRRSTRLNSSHGSSSYAVFCLKKKMRWIKAARGRGAGSPRRSGAESIAVSRAV